VSVAVETTHRFLRPADLGRIRRNQRRIQLTRMAVVARNVLFAGTLIAGAAWVYRETQSDTRFAVRQIEFAGAVHTPRAAIEGVTKHYAGLNLFRIDIARVQHDLRSLPWIQRIAIEKKLPNTLRINIVERTPAALLRGSAGFQYVDAAGVTLSELSPAVGDDDLPIVADAAGAELLRTMEFLKTLKQRDPLLYSRIGEIHPVPPRGFSIFDRELGAFIYVNDDDAAPKWRALYAIAQSEQFTRGGIEYADLRFADRVVVKPMKAAVAVTPPTHSTGTIQITN
jgi:cell division protein FtsQ